MIFRQIFVANVLHQKSYLHVFSTFFYNMKSCQNNTGFDLIRVLEMHIAQKNFEMHHSQSHIDLIAITRLVGYLDLHSKKSDSKRYLGVVFFQKELKISEMFLIYALHDHESRCV